MRRMLVGLSVRTLAQGTSRQALEHGAYLCGLDALGLTSSLEPELGGLQGSQVPGIVVPEPR